MQIEKYLPSKKFKYLLLSFILVAIIFFIVFKLFSNKNSFFTSKESAKLKVEDLTINNLIQRDSDNDGVTDWEEKLWGTDPNNKSTFGGIPDADYIRNKKSTLKTNEGVVASSGEATETEKFAKQFFASYAAMKASGQVNDTVINDFSNSLSQKVSDPNIIDQYSEKDLELTKGDESTDQENYYVTAAGMFEKYKKSGLGNELEIAGGMASTVGSNNSQNQSDLLKISSAYKEFAQELLLIPVPKSLLEYHLQIINNANNTGIAVFNMSKMLTDPLVGISGTSQYQKYSDALVASVDDLETFLTTNGIISSDSTTP